MKFFNMMIHENREYFISVVRVICYWYFHEVRFHVDRRC